MAPVARFPEAAERCVAALASRAGSAIRLTEVIEIVGYDLSFAVGTAHWDARALGLHPGGTRGDNATDIVRWICDRAHVMLIEPSETEHTELHIFMTSTDVVMQVLARKLERAAA